MTIVDREPTVERQAAAQRYYLDRTPERDGTYQVHRRGCRHFPGTAIYLGTFGSLREALRKARRYYVRVEGCGRCCE